MAYLTSYFDLKIIIMDLNYRKINLNLECELIITFKHITASSSFAAFI